MNFETNESSFYFFYSTLFAIITLRGAKKFKVILIRDDVMTASFVAPNLASPPPPTA